jgi:tetratricopeptide (TPR) repeat protein
MIKKIILLVATATGIVVLYWGGVLLKQSQDALNWPQTKGHMISSLLTIDHLPKFIDPRANPARWYGVQVQYEYKVADEIYLSDRLSPRDTQTRSPAEALNVLNKYRRQPEVTVFYDPRNPQEAFLEPGNIGSISLILILGGLLALGGILISYRQSLELNHKDSGYIHQGDIYQNQGKLAEALLEYDYAVRSNPNSVVGYSRRGGLYLQQQNWGSAIADFNRAVEIAPHDALSYFALGKAYVGNKEYDKALGYMYKAMDNGFHVEPEILESIKKHLG